jgi:hypothetical protein
MARICEQHDAADRPMAALAGFPRLTERVRRAVLHPEPKADEV